ncbi:MAG TPA: hypothetical protein VF541_09000 [Longimicrobium sp.]|jgi:hypothetical protein
MTLLASAPPQAALDAARAGVAQLKATPGMVSRDALGDEPGATYLAAPHQVFHVGLNDAIRGRPIEHARRGGWRFMLTNESRALAAVHVRECDEAPESYVFSQLNSGPSVDSTVEALHRLETAGEEFRELRLLDVPALYLEALWLHGDEDDRFMPLHPAPPSFEPYRLYSADEFSRVVTEVAAKRGEGPALAPP